MFHRTDDGGKHRADDGDNGGKHRADDGDKHRADDGPMADDGHKHRAADPMADDGDKRADMPTLRSNTTKTRVMHEATKKLRILTYNLSGDRVASAGVGTKDEPYTFPRQMEVGTLLGMGHWIKILPAPGPDGKDYECLPDFKPKTVVFVNRPDFVPTKWSQLGCQGCDRLTLLDTRCEEHYEEVPCADVSGVSTPPTPPSFW